MTVRRRDVHRSSVCTSIQGRGTCSSPWACSSSLSGSCGTRGRAGSVADCEQYATTNARPRPSPSTSRAKLEAFALAGFLAGLGGAVYGFALSQIDAAAFPVGASFDVTAMAVIGGLGMLAGPAIGAFYVAGVPAYLPLDNAGLAATALGWLLLVLYVPGGLAQIIKPGRDRLIAILARAAGEAPPDAREADASSQPSPLADGDGNGSGWRDAISRTLPTPPLDRDEPVLSAHKLVKRFGGVIAVDGVDLEVRAGEIVGLIGPNGAGKTTLFELIGGFTRVDSGTVLFGRRDLSSLGAAARARLGIVRSFQDAGLFPTLTVHETLQVALERVEPTRSMRALAGFETGTAKSTRADTLVELMGLDQYRDARVHELSTGTRRITELACLVALEPTVLLLDEPASGIAQRETEALGDLLLRIKEALDLTLVVVEHDIPMIMRLADRVVAMETGRVIAEGTPAQIRRNPLVIASYLGDDPAAIARSGRSRKTARA